MKNLKTSLDVQKQSFLFSGDSTWRRVTKVKTSSNTSRAFLYDVTAAILVYQNNETAAMLVYQENPVGIENFSHVKTFFCSKKSA